MGIFGCRSHLHDGVICMTERDGSEQGQEFDDPSRGGHGARRRPAKRRKAKRQIAKPETPASLERAALRYLERYAGTAANLKRVLERRLARARARLGDAQHDLDGPPEDLDGAVEAVVAKLVRAGLLDDGLYAEAKAMSLHRGGASRRRIGATLAHKGVPRELVAHALAHLDSAIPNAEFAAAVNYARRRRLGPFRAGGDRAGGDRAGGDRVARRVKDLASMARAGFAYSLAVRVVDAETRDALEDQGPADGA